MVTEKIYTIYCLICKEDQILVTDHISHCFNCGVGQYEEEWDMGEILF